MEKEPSRAVWMQWIKRVLLHRFRWLEKQPSSLKEHVEFQREKTAIILNDEKSLYS